MPLTLSFLWVLKVSGICLGLLLTSHFSKYESGSQARSERPRISGQGAPAEEKQELRLRPGMTKHEVVQLLGQPNQVSRQILYHRYLEQWHYSQGPITWIEFENRRGQDSQLQTVHRSVPPER